ncbi:MAG: single-stranded DNA-binding protein [Armatimonadota bacterium]
MLNRVILIGRLANDPELKYTPSGIAVATFTIAVNRMPNSQGEREADFIPIVAWRQSAEFAANYLTKGRLVAVEGKLQIRSWVAQDGTRRKSAEVVADNLRSLDRPKEHGEASSVPSGDDHGAGAVQASAEEFDDPFADE